MIEKLSPLLISHNRRSFAPQLPGKRALTSTMLALVVGDCPLLALDGSCFHSELPKWINALKTDAQTNV